MYLLGKSVIDFYLKIDLGTCIYNLGAFCPNKSLDCWYALKV